MPKDQLPLSVRLMKGFLGALTASDQKHRADLAASEREFREANPEFKNRAPINYTEGAGK